MKMFTYERIDITKRVDTGKTKIVATRKQAEELTKRSSYYYDVFDEKKNHIGFGIPR